MNENDLSISDLFKIIWKNIVLVLVLAIVFAIAVFGFAKLKNRNPSYAAQRNIVIYHNNTDQRGQFGQYTRDMGMMKTYKEIGNDDIILKSVQNKMKKVKGYSGTLKSLRTKVNVSEKDQSTVLTARALDKSPKIAATIANETASIYQKKVTKIINAGEVKLLAKADKGSAKIVGNLPAKKFAVIGFVFGGVVGILTAWVKDIFIKKLY